MYMYMYIHVCYMAEHLSRMQSIVGSSPMLGLYVYVQCMCLGADWWCYCDVPVSDL